MTGLTERLRQEGRRQGKQEGELAILSRQLERRFGPLGPAVTERLKKASAAELERWADNFVDARTLDEVFGTHWQPQRERIPLSPGRCRAGHARCGW